jgi:rfaE bifunctional protein nucleotidyltransferase chain/domain
MRDLTTKLISFDDLARWREARRAAGDKVVATNGCFDLLHAGHVTYLQAARQEGDVLLVGLNSDASVRQLKGKGRPINSQADRAAVLCALEMVDAVCIFEDLRATRFLERAQPDVYVKGGDLSIESIPHEERDVVTKVAGVIRIMPLAPGRSTTDTLRRITSHKELK